MDDEEIRLQRETGELVSREVYVNVTMLVDELLKYDEDARMEVYDLARESMDRAYECDDCEHTWEEDGDECDECPKCESASITWTNEDEDPPEVYEWWSVTSWAAARLKEQGEIIYENWGHYLWGRCSTGQALKLDECWRAIEKQRRADHERITSNDLTT